MNDMEYINRNEFTRRLARHDGFWAGKNSVFSITAPLSADKSTDIWYRQEQIDAKDSWRFFTDPELIHARDMNAFSGTYFAGDALPITHMNFGATGYAAFLKGIEYELRDSLWIHHIEEELEDFTPILDESSPLYQAEMNLLKFYEAQPSIPYLIGNPDNAGVLDAIFVLRGEELLFDLTEDPEETLRVHAQMQKIWETVIERTVPRLNRINGGRTCVGWLHTTAPGIMAQMQCDVSVMISPDMYRRFCMPELERQCELLEHPLYHLDGMEQVRHLDYLLSLERLETIQWTCVAGQPSPLEFLEPLKRIQRAGKRIIILCEKEEALRLAAELDDGPILLHIEADSPEEADRLAASLHC